MLKELHIKDFAIIDELRLMLNPGFNVLTGETGAGKSILIDAISLLLGGRASTAMIRAGKKRARLEGLFVLDAVQQVKVNPILAREGLESEDTETLWLSRELRSSGRTVARVNGSMVTLKLMREVAEDLVDIHGQGEHLSLLRVREHLYLLDRFADLENERAEVADAVRKLQAVRRELKTLRDNERERMQQIDLLRFQIQEIQSAAPKPEEKEKLERELNRLANAERLTSLVSNVLTLVEEGAREHPAILDQLGKAQREMDALTRIDESLTPQAEVLESVGYQLEDFSHTLRDYLAKVEFNPRRLVWAEERLSLLRQLERKYGKNLQEVLAYAQQAEVKLETLEHSDEHIAELQAEEATLLRKTAQLCLKLSEKRQVAAGQLAGRVNKELGDLRMEGARFGTAFKWSSNRQGLPLSKAHSAEVWVTERGESRPTDDQVSKVAFDATGMDRLEFLVAPNVGEGLKPIAQIASGGETARLMLALKTVLCRVDQTPTLIFDEIDQGIGGRVGGVVGAKLWRLTLPDPQGPGREHQVLCITHLPQLASFGGVHYRIEKTIRDGRTLTHVKHLNAEARLSELAQMLGTGSDTARQSAQDILKQAENSKQHIRELEEHTS